MTETAQTAGRSVPFSIAGDDEAAQVARYLDLVAELVSEFAANTDLEATLGIALQRIADAMDAEAASMFLLDGDELVCRACVGDQPIHGLRMPADAGVVGRTVATAEPQLVADVRADPDFYAKVSKLSGMVTRSLLTAPLQVRDQCLGVVELVNKKDPEKPFDERDARILMALATAAALALNNARLAAEMVDQARLRREVELAATVQQNLLPPESDADAPIAGVNLPARGMSGDFYDYLTLPGGDLLFAVGDVSGKGMNAALVMAKAVTLFRALGKVQPEPGRLMELIHSELRATMTMGMFVTLVIGRYSRGSGLLRLANAGHPPPLLLGPDTRVEFPAEAPPLGIESPIAIAPWCETAVRLRSGESVYIYTDGLDEATDADGAMLEVDGVIGLIERFAEAPVSERVRLVADAALSTTSGRRDDLTLLCLQRESRVPLSGARIEADAAQLKILRKTLRSACAQAGCTQASTDGIVLAVDEAAQNIIRHCYGTDGGTIEVELSVEDDTLEVRLIDFGPTTNPEQCQGRALEDVRPGGLGTHFMRALMDEVFYAPPPDGAGNCLVMRKKVR